MSKTRPDNTAQQAWAHLVDTGQMFLSRLRLKAFFWVLGIALATWAAIIFTSVAWIPVVGVAMAAVAVSINTIAHKLSRPTCFGCGHDLTGLPVGEHGTPCPTCGAIHMPRNAIASDHPHLPPHFDDHAEDQQA